VRLADGGVAGSKPATAASVSEALDNAPLSAFHRRAVVVSGVGFFTDAYDLFVISTVAVLVAVDWHLGTTKTSWVLGSAILGAFVGAMVFGRLADLVGRKKIYLLVAVVMVIGALSSALAPDLLFLVLARFVLGLGIGGDYPVSAVLMSEYANRHDRGRLVGLVFSMQALGLIVGPLVALSLLEAHVGSELTWRLLLGLGALPALGVIYLRSKIPESPRFQSMVQGRATEAATELAVFSGGAAVTGSATSSPPAGDAHPRRLGLRQLVRDRRMARLLVGTAGAWFVFDYAYYGNTLSLPAILKGVDPGADITAKLAWSLAMFVVFALPGYALAVLWMDRIGHRKLQLIGFSVLAAAFLLLAAVPVLTASVGAFLAVFGLSYFFVEFGPNVTTFVLPSEVFPVSARTTGHGISAGVGKLGAFAGVFLVPALQDRLGLRPMLAIAAVSAFAGIFLTRLLPETARRALEEVSGDTGDALLGEVPQAGTDEMDTEPSLAIGQRL
jgi:MFS transporter, PHS family, inorganic phosphate transporter